MTGFSRKLPTLGIYGPCGSDRSGVAKYVEASVPYLQEKFNVTVISNGSTWLDPWSFDVTVYHLGNNDMHKGAFEAAHMRPGVSLVHEYLHIDYYFQAWARIERARREAIFNLLGSAIGTIVGSLDEFFDVCDQRSIDRYALDVGIEQFVVDDSLVSLFHSGSVAKRMRSRYPRARIGTVPFPVTPADGMTGEGQVQRGIGSRSFSFGVFGFIGEYKRVASVLLAWRSWDDRPADARLLLVGERQVNLEYDDDSVLELGYVDDDEFVRFLAAVDCGIQLREPSLGETSAPAAWLVAHGRPVILSDIPEMRDLGRHDRTTYVHSGEDMVPRLVEAMRTQHALGRKAPTTFDERFSWSNWLSKMSAFLTTPGR